LTVAASEKIVATIRDGHDANFGNELVMREAEQRHHLSPPTHCPSFDLFSQR
jgi:hypothetical protein